MIRGLRLAALICAVVIGSVSGAAAVPPPGTYAYTVMHPDHGDIGTYTNVVRKTADGVSVDTSVRIEVKVAFLSVYKLNADRHEEWKNGRLVAYKSKTVKNGKEINISGQAKGDKFVIETASGEIVAPGDVVPTNPWSKELTEADVVMASESGRIFDARVATQNDTTVTVAGQPVQAKHFQLAADTRHDVWFDSQGRVVQFATNDDGTTISFLLRR